MCLLEIKGQRREIREERSTEDPWATWCSGHVYPSFSYLSEDISICGCICVNRMAGETITNRRQAGGNYKLLWACGPGWGSLSSCWIHSPQFWSHYPEAGVEMLFNWVPVIPSFISNITLSLGPHVPKEPPPAGIPASGPEKGHIQTVTI